MNSLSVSEVQIVSKYDLPWHIVWIPERGVGTSKFSLSENAWESIFAFQL